MSKSEREFTYGPASDFITAGKGFFIKAGKYSWSNYWCHWVSWIDLCGVLEYTTVRYCEGI